MLRLVFRARCVARFAVGGNEHDRQEGRLHGRDTAYMVWPAEHDKGLYAGLTNEELERRKVLERMNRVRKRSSVILRKMSVCSPGRSSAAVRSEGVVHRRTPCQIRGLVDLRVVAYRPVGVFQAQGP